MTPIASSATWPSSWRSGVCRVRPHFAPSRTISRLENLPGARSLLRMGRAMVEFYCSSFRQVPRRIVLDIDYTFDAVHGGQQLGPDERTGLLAHTAGQSGNKRQRLCRRMSGLRQLAAAVFGRWTDDGKHPFSDSIAASPLSDDRWTHHRGRKMEQERLAGIAWGGRGVVRETEPRRKGSAGPRRADDDDAPRRQQQAGPGPSGPQLHRQRPQPAVGRQTLHSFLHRPAFSTSPSCSTSGAARSSAGRPPTISAPSWCSMRSTWPSANAGRAASFTTRIRGRNPGSTGRRNTCLQPTAAPRQGPRLAFASRASCAAGR